MLDVEFVVVVVVVDEVIVDGVVGVAVVVVDVVVVDVVVGVGDVVREVVVVVDEVVGMV